ncbi:hypothetical protein MBLNU230_g2829t1 [Neophaeotheca triangularis]
MLNTILASAALFAASAAAQGSAVVINKCNYDVFLANTPASTASNNGGFDIIHDTLSPNDVYTQQWTELDFDGGWSIKLSKNENSFHDNILQYEYTFFNNDIIWYDLSAVNGNPWNGNWEISADDSEGCSPRQAAYRYATDDAYGMQSCPAESTITVVLCSGEEQADDLVASISASDAAPPSAPTIDLDTQNRRVSPADNGAVETSSAPSPTTFETMVTEAPQAPTNVDVNTIMETEVVTQVYTMWRHRHGRHGGRA